MESPHDSRFINKIRHKFREAEVELLTKAYVLSTKTGTGRHRVSLKAAEWIFELGADAATVAAVLLVQALWEGRIRPDEIRKEFGGAVAAILRDFHFPFVLRIHAESRPRSEFQALLGTLAKSPRKTLLFLALRLIELEYALEVHPPNSRRMAQETIDFYVPIADRLGLGGLRRRIEDVCFHILEPAEYEALKQNVAPIQAEDDKCLEILTRGVKRLLNKNGLTAEIEGRTKSLHGIHRKMIGTGRSLNAIMDRIGIRIIVASVPECYTVLGLLHTHFKPIPGTFDDYIGLPKDNGYQSLHTCVYPVREITHKPIEFQVRTELMHKEAEHGTAAHWLYKNKTLPAKNGANKKQWIKSLLHQHRHANNPHAFIALLHKQVYADHLVVFGKGGRITRLPHSATVRDYLNRFNIHAGPETVVRVNGEVVGLDRSFQDGDSIEIIPKAKLRRRKSFILGFIIIFSAFLHPHFADARQTLRMIGPEDVGGAWGEVISRFHAAHPDITIDYISGPWSTDERQNMYIRSFLGGDAVELVYMDVIWTAKFAAQGWLLPLDRWFSPESREAFFPGDIEAGIYEGRIYRVPVRTDVGMLYYRKDLLPEPPRTWEEFEAACRACADPPERYCIVFQGMQYEGLVCNYLEYLWGAGGAPFDSDQNVLLNGKANIAALSFMKKVVDSGWAPRSVLTFQEQQSLEFFEQGKALMMRNWPYAWTVLSRSPLAGKVGIVPFIHRTGKEPAGTLGGWGLGIARSAQFPDAAWKFIEFATSPEAEKILHFRRGAVPARKSLFADEAILKASPHYMDLYDVLLNARPRPIHPEYPRISSILQKHVSAVLVGIETPEEAARRMDRSVESLLKGKRHSWPVRLFLDYDLKTTLKNTFVFTAFSVPCEFLLGLLFALLTHHPFRGRSLSRLAVLVPWALPTAVMAMSWQWMFNNPFGVINDLLVRTGLLQEPLDWLSSPAGAMFAAVFADVWKTTPFVAIILLAGLQTIPGELKESLSIDGGGGIAMFFHLLLPLLMPFIRVALIFRIIHAAGIFDLIWVLTKGGPADTTRTLSIYIYDLAFRYDEVGYALFLTFLFLIGLVLLSLLIVRATTFRYERV